MEIAPLRCAGRSRAGRARPSNPSTDSLIHNPPMTEVRETTVDMVPDGNPCVRAGATGRPDVTEEARVEASVTLLNDFSRNRRLPRPDEPVSYLRVWRIGDGERRGAFLGRLLTVIEGAALMPHVFDFKWSDRNNQREVVLQIATSGAPTVKHALGKFVRDSKCRISWSLPFRDRAARRKERVRSLAERKRESGLSYPARFVSWNVRGFAGKKVEICASLNRMRAAAVGLQETLVTEDRWQLRIPRFRVYARPADGEGGYCGVALAISRRLVSFETGPQNRLWVCAKVLGLGQGDAWYVINVYRSQRRELSHEFPKLRDYVNHLRETDRDARIVVMGDFNWDPVKLERGILRPCRMFRVPFKGSDKTFCGGPRTRWTAIDHFVVCGNVLGLLSKTSAGRAYSASDHFPISMKVRRPVERTGEDEGERGPVKLLERERLHGHCRVGVSVAVRPDSCGRVGAVLAGLGKVLSAIAEWVAVTSRSSSASHPM